MSKTLKIILVIVLILLIAGILIYYFGIRTASLPKVLKIATIWEVPDIHGQEPSFENASIRVNKTRQGFVEGMLAGMDGTEYTEVVMAENDDLRDYVTDISEVFSNYDVLLTVGSSSDEATMYASMEMNYFKIPMLIPFADGDLSPDNTGTDYSLRMTPTSSKYAKQIGTMFPAEIFSFINSTVFGDGPVPDYHADVAVFLADNFNGNETGVKITQVLMDNGYNVDVYEPFKEGTLLTTVQNAWNLREEKMTRMDAVLIIGEDADPMPDLSKVWHLWQDKNLDPDFLLIGYVPVSVDEEMAAASNIFALQPALRLDTCPAGIVNRSEAMGYAAGLIAAKGLREADKVQPNEKGGYHLWFRTEAGKRELHEEDISSFRSNIRSVIYDMDEDVPCYGHIRFRDDPDLRIDLELVHYTDENTYQIQDPMVIINNFVGRIQYHYGTGRK